MVTVRKNSIDLTAGDTVVVDGQKWTYQADGTLAGPGIDATDATISTLASQDANPIALNSSVDVGNNDITGIGSAGADSLNNIHYVTGTSIQAVIDEVELDGGGTVIVPPGTYDEALTLPSKVRLIGSGQSDPNLDQETTTIRRPDTHDGPVITVVEGTGRVHKTTIQNLNVVGRKSVSGVTSGNGQGILIDDGERCVVRDVTIWNCVDEGLKCASGIAMRLINVSSRANNVDGIFLSACSDSNVVACDVGSNERHALLITGNGNVVLGGEFYINKGQGIRVDNAIKNRIVGVRSNNNQQGGILMTAGSAKTVVTGAMLPNNGGAGVKLQDSSGNVITGCQALEERTDAGTDPDIIDMEYGIEETGTSNQNIISDFRVEGATTAEYSLIGPVTTYNSVGTDDLGVTPTSTPSGDFPEGTTVRNSNPDNNEAWMLIDGTWAQIA